jgi:SAM-dependent methyltransferase
MSHHSSGLHRILDRPRIYDRLQRFLGAERARRRLVDDFLRPFQGARLLDVGCGTGSLLDYLPKEVEYVGFDLNPAYIEAACERYGERAKFFCVRVGSERNVIGGSDFDFVVATSLLHHLTDDEARHVLQSALQFLRPGGVFFSSDNVIHEKQSPIARFLISLDRGRNVRTPEGYRRLVGEFFPNIDAQLVTDLAPFPYSHYIIRAVAPR